MITTVVTMLAVSAGIASAASAIAGLNQIEASNSDMGSGAIEWSGATYNASSGVLLTVDDEHNAYEFTLDDRTALVRPQPRIVRVAVRPDTPGGDLLGRMLAAATDTELARLSIPRAEHFCSRGFRTRRVAHRLQRWGSRIDTAQNCTGTPGPSNPGAQ